MNDTSSTASKARISRHAPAALLTIATAIVLQFTNEFVTRWLSNGVIYMNEDIAKGQNALWCFVRMILVDIAPFALFYGASFIVVSCIGAFLSSSVAHGIARAQQKDA